MLDSSDLVQAFKRGDYERIPEWLRPVVVPELGGFRLSVPEKTDQLVFVFDWLPVRIPSSAAQYFSSAFRPDLVS